MGKVSRWFPRCFSDARQYRRWCAEAVKSGEAALRKRSGYCVDCTPEFKLEMKREGRCAHPEVKFALDADGYIIGLRRLKMATIKKTGSFHGKSNALGHGGRAAQMKAQGVPGGVIGKFARRDQAAPGQKNYHGPKAKGK